MYNDQASRGKEDDDRQQPLEENDATLTGEGLETEGINLVVSTDEELETRYRNLIAPADESLCL